MNNTFALQKTILKQSVTTLLKPTWLIVYQNFMCYTRMKITEILVYAQQCLQMFKYFSQLKSFISAYKKYTVYDFHKLCLI